MNRKEASEYIMALVEKADEDVGVSIVEKVRWWVDRNGNPSKRASPRGHEVTIKLFVPLRDTSGTDRRNPEGA